MMSRSGGAWLARAAARFRGEAALNGYRAALARTARWAARRLGF